MSSGLLVIPGVSVCLPYLDVIIKDYYLEVYPCLRVPRFSLLCAPWQKTRPNSKRCPFTSFCFVRFFQVFGLFLCFVPRGKRVREGQNTPPAPAVEWSSQPVMVSPAGSGRILTRLWPKVFLTFVSCVFSPGGLLIPLSCPMDFFWGGTKVLAVEAGPRDEATATRDHLPLPPELPAPPWPPSVCSTLEAPSCVCICVGPEGSPECPPPLPGSTVTARDVPSGRGVLCQTSVLCSRLLFPYMVCFLSSFHVIMSLFCSRCVFVIVLIIRCI